MLLRSALVIFTFAATLLSPGIPGSSPVASAAGPAPVIYAHAMIYHWGDGHWKRTTTLSMGDRARIVLLFRMRGWTFPHARLVVREGWVPANDRPVVYQVSMCRLRIARGFTRFWHDLRITPHLVGKHVAMFVVSNGSGRAGVSLRLRVKK